MGTTAKKKKSILWLSITILVFAILFALGIYYYREIYSTPTVDRYQSVVDNCEVNTQGMDLVATCKGFVESIKRNGNETVCIDISIVIKDSQLKEESVCVQESALSWDPSTMISDSKVPVYLVMSYNMGALEYKFKNISLQLVSDPEIFALLEELHENGVKITGVRTESMEKLNETGYSTLTRSIDEEDGKEIGSILFINADVTNIEIVGEDINFYADLEVNSKKVPVSFSTERFYYITDVADLNVPTVTYLEEDSLAQIEKYDSVQLRFFYLPLDSALTFSDFKTYCQSIENNTFLTIMCSVADNPNLSNSRVKIDEYINEISNSNGDVVNIDKLMLGVIAVNE